MYLLFRAHQAMKCDWKESISLSIFLRIEKKKKIVYIIFVAEKTEKIHWHCSTQKDQPWPHIPVQSWKYFQGELHGGTFETSK